MEHARSTGSGVAAAASLMAAVALGVGAAPVAAQPVELFRETTPGVYDDVMSVPAGVCFVSIVADGGHGGGALFIVPVAGGVAASVSARVPVTPGASLSVVVAAGGDSGDGGTGGIGGGGAGGDSALGYAAGGGGAATAGGGGGSSFVSPAAVTSSSVSSVLTSDGQVTITSDPATDGCPAPPFDGGGHGEPAPAAVVVAPRFTG